MGKYDVIDIVFISLISFYLLIFTTILILLIWKHRGIRGLFRYLLDRNAIVVTTSGEVIDHTEKIEKKKNKKEKKLSNKNRVTIKEFFEKRIKSLKKDIAKGILDVKKEEKKTSKKKDTNKKTSTKTKKSNNTKKTSTKKKTTTAKKKANTTSKKSSTTKKKTNTNKKKTSKK